MIRFDINIQNNITPTLKKMKAELNKLPDEAYKFFVQQTPVRSGNARRKTKLRSKKEIVADYPYAERLDTGYSKQSPEGMTGPTEEFIVDRFNKIMSGK